MPILYPASEDYYQGIRRCIACGGVIRHDDYEKSECTQCLDDEEC